MTLEEQIAQLTRELEEQKAINKTLSTNISNQNAYITKLEGANNAQKAPNSTVQLDPMLQEYLKKTMRKDVMDKSIAVIRDEFSNQQYSAVEKDFLEFLDKNMTESKTTPDYILDAFSLVLGRALRDKNHPIHSVGKVASPGDTPASIVTNAPTVSQIQDTLKSKLVPPVMTGKDTSAMTAPPNTSTAPQNTKSAFEQLKSKFATLGENKFQ